MSRRLRPVAARQATLLVGICLIAGSLSGCSQRDSQQQSRRVTPFVFQVLNLSQQDAQGRLLWQVTSPEARYDLSRRLALARQLRGEIHANGQALYRLQASHGTVLRDGEVIQLEGDVTVERLGAEPVTIQASRMRWYPRQQRLELDRHAQAQDRTLKLTAAKATLLLDRDLLQLRGQPLLQTRQGLGGAMGLLRVQLRQIDWAPGSGRLSALGPVLASSRGHSGGSRNLSAAGLEGNTATRRLTLLAPVRLEAPDQGAWLQAQTSSVDLSNSTVASTAGFSAAVGPLRISGQGLRLNLASSNAEILSGCSLVQPDAALSAQRCRWNWQSDLVSASGDVELRRQANRQTTRAQELRGRVGAAGLLEFSSPGSRVRSTLVLPPPRSDAKTRAAATRL
ncbi:MAG: LPS export ABC transporter periplasmic protein LptC [Cyanobacteriota bacterium]|nr:LPS export ABC transporter periplasmic protein LptC [Cyanobacteriota bacterium]